MKSEIEVENTAVSGSFESPRVSGKPRLNPRIRPVVFSILASLGIFGGISSLFVGLVCVVIHGIVSHDVVFDRVGTVLLIIAIPMILTGSMFIDEINAKDN